MPTAVEFSALLPAVVPQQPATLNGIIIVGGLGGLAQRLPAVQNVPRG